MTAGPSGNGVQMHGDAAPLCGSRELSKPSGARSPGPQLGLGVPPPPTPTQFRSPAVESWEETMQLLKAFHSREAYTPVLQIAAPRRGLSGNSFPGSQPLLLPIPQALASGRTKPTTYHSGGGDLHPCCLQPERCGWEPECVCPGPAEPWRPSAD